VHIVKRYGNQATTMKRHNWDLDELKDPVVQQFRGDYVAISRRFLATENSSPWAILWRC